METEPESAAVALAFGEGCDARHNGWGIEANFYSDPQLRKYWLKGWNEADRCWGIWSKTPVRRLPEIKPGDLR